MVVLFMLAGMVSGGTAAGFTIWSGGSVLLAISAYTLTGAMGACGVVFAASLVQRACAQETADWAEDEVRTKVASA